LQAAPGRSSFQRTPGSHMRNARVRKLLLERPLRLW
jgi:hypothetical protein